MKRIKYLGINLHKETKDLYTESYKKKTDKRHLSKNYLYKGSYKLKKKRETLQLKKKLGKGNLQRNSQRLMT